MIKVITQNTEVSQMTRKISFFWLLTGRQENFACDVPVTASGSTTADCHYHDVIDLRSGDVVGTAIDSSTDPQVVGDRTHLIGTTFFTINAGPVRGTLVMRALGVIAPLGIDNTSFAFQGVNVDLLPAPVSHFAAIPAQAGANNVLNATGDFAGAAGRVALFGQLGLTQPGIGAYNCLFHLQLELPA